MNNQYLILIILVFLIISCNNRTNNQTDTPKSDTLAVTQPFIPSLPEGKDSTFIMDTMDFGTPIADNKRLSLDDILEKHFEAIGQDKIDKLKTKIITGKTFAGGRTIRFKNIFKRPDKSYAEVDYGEHQFYQGYDGNKGWRLYTLESDVPLQVYGEQLQAIKDQSKFDNPLAGYKETGLQLKLAGLSEINGIQVYQIKLVNEGINEIYYFIDAEDFKLIKILTRITYPNQESDYETIFSDFKKTDGMLIALQTEEIVNNQQYSRMVIEKIEFDVAVDDNIFKIPESTP